jgi:polar amino acid transport system ATP-binding protein
VNTRPAIELVALEKRFGNLHVLRGIDLAIATGEVVCLVGPSGSGKSTLLRCVNRLEQPTGGRILIDGENICEHDCDLDRVRTKIGMVFQHFNLFPHLSVLGNLMIAQCKVLKRSKAAAEQKARTVLERVGLSEKIHEYPSRLSGGQQQRVAIARALAMDPEMMLFDEATSALDPELVGEVSGRGRHDHDGGDPRDGLRPAGRRPGRVHGRRRGRGGRPSRPGPRRSAAGAHETLPAAGFRSLKAEARKAIGGS